jgi:1-acyl-sn-glycerol-3-phosphate acyltransferase
MYEPSIADRISGSAPLRRRQATGRLLARSLTRLEVNGLENVPAGGPVVLAVNHRDFFDGPLVFGFVRRPVNFLVKIEAFTPRAGPFLRTTGQIPVIRTRHDYPAIRLTLRLLRAGGVVGIFPEGSRGDGLARTVKPGVGYFALRTGAAVVPIACHGTDSIKNRRWRRPRVRITVGEPLHFERVPEGRRVRRADVLEATERIRAALAGLVKQTSFDETERTSV